MNFASEFVYGGDMDEVSMDEEDFELGVENEALSSESEGDEIVPKGENNEIDMGEIAFDPQLNPGVPDIDLNAILDNQRAQPAQPAPKLGFFQRLIGAGAPPRPPQQERRGKPKPKKRYHKKKMKKGRVLQRKKINTNVLSLNLGTLKESAEALATGDPVMCENEGCKSFFNHLSKNFLVADLPKAGCSKAEYEESIKNGKKIELEGEKKEGNLDLKIGNERLIMYANEEYEEDDSLWICEFCGHRNIITIEREEIPTANCDYILEAAQVEKKQEGEKDEGIIVLCIDVSGSMCCTQELKGKKLNLKNKKKEQDAFLDLYSPEELQFGRQQLGQMKSTWVSRLDCVRGAIDSQIDAIYKKNPNKRVALVTFSNDVTIVGDGKTIEKTVAGGKLNKEDALRALASDYEITHTLKETKDALIDKIWSLTEKGQTSLGPALVLSVGLAAQYQGSRVVLCTDGLANIGLGALGKKDMSEAELTKVEKWYEDQGLWAQKEGVVVDILSISGDNCRIENLGIVSDKSGGSVDKINPLDIDKNFAGIFEKEVLATHVKANFLIHNGLFILNQEKYEVEAGQEDVSSRVVQDIGNVTEDTEVFFEYGIRKGQNFKERGISELPFQVQVFYRSLNGAKCVRIMTQVKKLNYNKDEINRDLDVDVMAHNVKQKAGILAQKGDYESARGLMLGNAVWMRSNAKKNKQQKAQFKNYALEVQKFDNMIKKEIHQEAEEQVKFADVKVKKKSRARRRNDEVANLMYSMKNKK